VGDLRQLGPARHGLHQLVAVDLALSARISTVAAK
jgi:hypothetical protein